MSHTLFHGLRKTSSRHATTSQSPTKAVRWGDDQEPAELSPRQRLLRRLSQLTTTRHRHRPGRRGSAGSETPSTSMISEESSQEERQELEDTSSPEYLLRQRGDLLFKMKELKQRNAKHKLQVVELYGGTLLTTEQHTQAQGLLKDIESRKYDISALKLKVSSLEDRLTALGVKWQGLEGLDEDLANDGEVLCQFCHEEEANAFYLCSHPKNACLECAEALMPNVARCAACQKVWQA